MYTIIANIGMLGANIQHQDTSMSELISWAADVQSSDYTITNNIGEVVYELHIL